VCGDEGVSVRELLVVLALDVLACPWPGMRGRFLDDVPDVELDRVGRFARWDWGTGSTLYADKGALAEA